MEDLSFVLNLNLLRSLVLVALVLSAAFLSIFAGTRRSSPKIPVVEKAPEIDLPAFVSNIHRKVMWLTSFVGII